MRLGADCFSGTCKREKITLRKNKYYNNILKKVREEMNKCQRATNSSLLLLTLFMTLYLAGN